MMNFRLLKAAIVDLLKTEEAGRYRTFGFQRKSIGTAELQGNLRNVSVYFESGQFIPTSSRMTGSVRHIVTIVINFLVSETARVNLSLLNNIGSSPSQRAAALADMETAAERVDNSFDELVDIVYQVLMSPLNYDLGMGKGAIADRWIDSVQKNDVLQEGEHFVLTGSMPITVNVVEDLVSEIGTPADTIDTTLVVKDDENTKAGKTVINI